MIDTPNKFIVKTNHINPPYNDMIFEEYFYRNYKDIKTDREYLPILWTNFYISRNYAQQDMSDLQCFLDSLDTKKKYFTIIQWDDGILHNINHLDIKIFGSGGGSINSVSSKNIGDIAIPLICKPNPHINKNRHRNILCSFVGAIRNRHYVREEMFKKLSNLDGFLIIDTSEHKKFKYCDEIVKKLSNLKKFLLRDLSGYKKFKYCIERSIFVLCPRGYGATSFRICESLQYGAIPIYLYDKPWIPWKNHFNFNDIGILCHVNDIGKLPELIRQKSENDIKIYIENGKKIYKEYFDYDGCAKKIIENL